MKTLQRISTIENVAFVSNRYPIGTTLDSTGIQDDNWTVADRLYIWNGSNWDAYLFSTFWRKTTAGGVNANSTPIEPDSAMFIKRSTPIAAPTADVTHPKPYTQ